MKRRLLSFFAILIALSFGTNLNAQWNLVWADEFNGSMSSDWIIETGTGSGGWGNNELQYYRAENISVVNGALQIQARNESFGGMSYTSGRMKTEGRRTFKYGKVEARIAMPAFSGVWPAFWMLGQNIGSVGWPACGEIDIMEHVNAEYTTYGTIHWQDHNNSYASYSGNTGVDVTQYHVYAVEWDANAIKWFVDGVQFHEASIAGSVNGTDEFHNDFFLILNMAIGGNWPGYNIDNGAMPANMLVDYVRVYEAGSGNTGGVTNLAGQYYIQNRKSGLYIDVADWGTQDGANLLQWNYHGGNNQKFEFIHQGDGVYIIKSVHSGKVMDIAGISTDNFANVHQWTDYGTPNQRFRVTATGDGFYQLTATHSNKVVEVGYASLDPGANINQYDNNGQLCSHWNLVPVGGGSSWATTIEAESYMAMSGVDLENCSEGGQNVGWIDAGDWMAYNAVNFPAAGTYTVEYRVASVNGGQLSLDLDGGATQLGSINIPATGGWQNWTTISHNVNVPSAGNHNVGIYAQTGGWNINWFAITQGYKSAGEESNISSELSSFNVYPNPAQNEITIEGLEDISAIDIVNIQGKVVLTTTMESGMNSLDISELTNGVYILRVSNSAGMNIQKFIKQ